MDTNAYLTFLAIGVLMVLIDGQVIYRSGRRYLAGTDDDPAASASMTRMVTVLFHLVVLGLLALLSIVDIGGSSIQGVVGRLGVLLLVLALVHAGTVAILARMRESQAAEAVTASRAAHRGGPTTDPVVAPVPGQHGRDPKLSPGIENKATERGAW